MGVLFALIAIGIGLVWYAGLQPQIPHELSFLSWDHHNTAVATSPGAVDGQTNTTALTSATAANGWQVTYDDDGFEYNRDFAGGIRAANVTYDAPVLGLTCYHNVPYVHIDTRLRARGTAKYVQVAFNGQAGVWTRADQGQQVFAPNSVELMRGLRGRTAAEVRLGFEEAPEQTLQVTLPDISKILDQFHKECGLPN